MNRIILLLAGSGLAEREIARALSELRRMDDSELFELLGDLRSCKESARRGYRWRALDTSEVKASLFESDQMLGHQVSKMLREETGFTTVEASERLLRAVGKTLAAGEVDYLPKLNKESFTKWVLKLSQHVSASVLLHEAAKIRNRHSHSSKTDWPLGEREK